MKEIKIKNKEKFFKKHYPFYKTPKLTDKKYCVHCYNSFTVGDFRVIEVDGRKLISCPNPDCDGTVIDWC